MIISGRHKKPIFRTKIARKISDIPAEDWKKVFPDVLEGYDFFRTLDESGMGQFLFYYIMVYDGKLPVGATTCFMVNYSLDTSINGPMRRITNSIKKLKPDIFSIKALICGAATGKGRIGLAADKDAVFKVMFRKMEHLAKKNRAAVIAFKDFDRDYSGLFDTLHRSGFIKVDSLPNAEMDIRYRDFEEYLKALSHDMRYDLRRKFKKTEGCVKIDLKITDDLEADELKDVYRMYLDMIERNDMNFEILPVEFFRDISRNMPGRTRFFLWKIDGKIAAFLFSLVSEEIFMDYCVGLDYSLAHKYHLYFLHFRDSLNWCIRNGIKQYDMGITAYFTKLRLGFDLKPLYIYAKLRNRALRPAFNIACRLLKFENFDPELKAAKKKARI
jgi:hypothetical protein